MKILSSFVFEIKKKHLSIHDICKILIVYVQLIPLGNLTVGQVAKLVNINITLCFWIRINKRSLNKWNEFQIMLMIFFCLRVYQFLFLMGNYRNNILLFSNVLKYKKKSELLIDCFIHNINKKFNHLCLFVFFFFNDAVRSAWRTLLVGVGLHNIDW